MKLLVLDGNSILNRAFFGIKLLTTKEGDFTNGTAFRDFLFRLPRDLHDLARCLLDRDSLEEARSSLGWSQMRMCGAVERLREHLEAYEKI